MPPYETRYVCYLDILGFRDLVGRMETDEPLARKVHSLLTRVGMVGPMTSSARPQTGSAVQFTVFSDSIVFSDLTPLNILFLCSTSIATFAEEGVFLRGGVAKGLLFHADQVVYGPAMIDAVELEETASVPRVLLQSQVVADLQGERGADTSIATDVDSRFFLRPFDGLCAAMADLPRYPEWFHRVRAHIEKGLESAHRQNDSSVVSKYTWLAEQLNAAIERYSIDGLHSIPLKGSE